MHPGSLENGLIAVVKRDCPTCELTAPVLGDLAQRVRLQIYTQDDPAPRSSRLSPGRASAASRNA